MAQKKYRYSLRRHDSKLAGVCSTIGAQFGIDPTIVRLGFAAAVVLVSWEVALVTYVSLGIYFAVQRKREVDRGARVSDFERMDQQTKVRPTIHALRTELDVTDRRLMAIDDHLAKPNHELAREIDALREEK